MVNHRIPKSKHKKRLKNKKSRKNKIKNNVNNDSKHLIIGKITADWCGHCQSLKPKWDLMENEIITNYAPSNFIKPINNDIIYLDNNKYNKSLSSTPLRLQIHKIDSQNQEEPIRFINDSFLKSSNDKLHDNGYPTIFKIYDNKLHYYQGEREPQPMKTWFLTNN